MVYAVSRNTGPCPDQLTPDSTAWLRTDDRFSESITVTCDTWDSPSGDWTPIVWRHILVLQLRFPLRCHYRTWGKVFSLPLTRLQLVKQRNGNAWSISSLLWSSNWHIQGSHRLPWCLCIESIPIHCVKEAKPEMHMKRRSEADFLAWKVSLFNA